MHRSVRLSFRPARLLVPALRLILAAAAAALAAAPHAHAQCNPQVVKLLGTGVSPGAYVGGSVAISADGNTVMTGASNDTGGVGSAIVFIRSGGAWTQQGAKISPTSPIGASHFGTAVALSADGNTAVIGAPNDTVTNGAIYIFVRSGSTWAQQGPKITPIGGGGPALFGFTVSISSDGNTVAAGAPMDNSNAGAVFTFTRSGSTWTQMPGKLFTSAALGASRFGAAVALNGFGNVLAVGAPSDNGYQGAAYVYIRAGNAWNQQSPKLIGTDAIADPQFGTSVALSNDGNTAMIGAYSDDSNNGAAYIFGRTLGAWTQRGPKLIPTGAIGPSYFGHTVSLNADGTEALVSGYGDNGHIGAAYVFARTAPFWTQQGDKLVATGGIGATPRFGICTALSADGSTAALGAYSDDSYNGAVYIVAVNPQVNITQNPVDTTVVSGSTTSFTVAATSAVPLTYQWRRHGVNIVNGVTPTGTAFSGATSATLSLSSVSVADNGEAFDCIVSNTCGSRQSNPAGLAVTKLCLADIASLGGSPSPDGQLTADDVILFLQSFFAGCP